MANLYDKSSLVLIPSGTKTGKVYSQVPTNGDGDFTFTRSSAATRVNADGNIEKETENKLLQSNSFDTTWSAINLNVTSGQAGYDGSNDAFLFTATANNARVTQNPNTSGVQTFSVYAKKGNTNWIRLRCDFSGGIADGYFALHTGALGSTTNCIDSNIESVGGDWYRCSITLDKSITAHRIYVTNNNGSSGSSGNSAYIQDAQLEQGLVARDYIETTTSAVYGGITDNVPRLDYTDSSCPALLLEPLRTNGIAQSEYFESWIQDGITTSSNTTDTLSPEGLYNASKITAVSGNQRIYVGSTHSAGVITGSCYVKAGTTDVITFNASSFLITYNLTTLAVTETIGTGTITPVGNGWYRVTATSAVSASANRTPEIVIDTASAGEYCYIYGAMIGVGNYETSYIPTYGSSVSRVADAALSSTLNLSKADFTLFVEFEFYGVKAGDEQRFYISRGVDNDSAILGIKNGTQIQITLQSGGVTLFNDTLGAQFSAGNNYKYLGKWSSGDNKSFLNGVQKTSNTTTYSDFTTDITHLNLTGTQPTTAMSDYGLKVKQVLYFPTALTDQEAIDLTTL